VINSVHQVPGLSNFSSFLKVFDLNYKFRRVFKPTHRKVCHWPCLKLFWVSASLVGVACAVASCHVVRVKPINVSQSSVHIQYAFPAGF
jgi:hypothetical protein